MRRQIDGIFISDDMASPTDIEDIQAARVEYKNGETVDINDIDW